VVYLVRVMPVAEVVAVVVVAAPIVAVGPSLEAPLIMGRAVDSDLFMSQETWLMAIVHRH
jgi:hypothetical protein